MAPGCAVLAAAAVLCLCAVVAPATAQAVRLAVFNNTALVLPAMETRAVADLSNITLGYGHPASAEATGTITLPRNDTSLFFDCNFQGIDLAFLHVGDHLVCQTGAYTDPGVDNPVWALSADTLVFRLSVVVGGSAPASASILVGLGVVPGPAARDSARESLIGNTRASLSAPVEGTASPYFAWVGWYVDTPHHTIPGGDLKNVTLAECMANCEQLVPKGCVAFSFAEAYGPGTTSKCYPKKREDAAQTCDDMLMEIKAGFSTYTRNASCHFKPPFKPNPAPGPPPPPPPAPATPIPASWLSPTLPPTEVQRRALQDGLKQGWGHWSHGNALKLALLPEGISANLGLCQISTRKCVNQILTSSGSNPDRGVRVGNYAYDHSYAQTHFWANGLNVSLEVGGGAGELSVLMSVNSGNASDYVAVLVGGTLWARVSTVTAAHGVVAYDAYGLRTVSVSASGAASDCSKFGISGPCVAQAFADGAAGFSSGAKRSTTDLAKALASLSAAEAATYSKYGALAEVKAAIQSGVMWNLIFTPAEYGPFSPVAEDWNFAPATSPDYNYAMFDWDNIFAAYMFALDSKELAYSNLIQVIKSKTNNGFVPNFAAGTRQSSDRTEPPVGVKVLSEIYAKYKEKWIVELLFDDLLDWSNWFMLRRRLSPLGLICLGGDGMQPARWESGMDNSPMYDGDFWNVTTRQMQLYDVGMTSMFIMEATALSKLAAEIGRPEAQMLRERAASMTALLQAHLWDEQGQIFTNKWSNGTFYRRISPTSFYSMLTSAPTDGQAGAMMAGWLMNRTRFCINANGSPQGNDPSACYWGLPSISADDPAFPPLGYWRGYVWGPMTQITYWALQNYDHVPAVRTGRKALTEQMTAMFMNQWHRNHHICENFSPHQNATDCTGDRFYHWGGLAGFLSILEAAQAAAVVQVVV